MISHCCGKESTTTFWSTDDTRTLHLCNGHFRDHLQMSIYHWQRVKDTLLECQFNNWYFNVAHSEDRVYIYASWRARDNFKPAAFPEVQNSRRWLIRPEASKS